MNYFVEGLQGSGKSTLAKLLAEKHPGHKALEEGDYSPVELSWCAWMSEGDYQGILAEFPDLRSEIEAMSHRENGRVVVCYTKIRTGNHSFYRKLEEYEIYNNRTTLDAFKEIVLTRYRNWQEEDLIVECSLFQNIVEDMILFRCMPDDEIIAFYREIKKAVGSREIQIIYLRTAPEDIRNNLEKARKERTDENGNEVWFGMLCDYFDHCPYAVSHGFHGAEGLVRHWEHRQELELRICEEVFPGQYKVLPSKNYDASAV